MTDPFSQSDSLAGEIFSLLQQKSARVVLAESCTCGLIASLLARIPGMSAVLAGSFVVYQVDSKVSWLDVPQTLIDQYDVVSSEVAAAMAEGALRKTPHATIAVSITGHLGPGAPVDLDGTAWLGIAQRELHVVPATVRTLTKKLALEAVPGLTPLQIRRDRQFAAALMALQNLRTTLLES
ncbi:MAG: CinA family protein [Planctomycetaceae bacterium]|nr:CinA family protein [Planctomycetaceae bacterium]